MTKMPELKTRQNITDWVNDELEKWDHKTMGLRGRMIWQTKEARLRLKAAGISFHDCMVRTPKNRLSKEWGNAHITCVLDHKIRRKHIRAAMQAGLGVLAYGYPDKTQKYSDWHYVFVTDYSLRGKLKIMKNYSTVRTLDYAELTRSE